MADIASLGIVIELKNGQLVARQLDDIGAKATALGKKGEEGGKGLGKVEHALSGIAISEAGLDPHLAHLTTALGGLAIEGPLMIGILAAGAAVSLAWKHWDDDAEHLTAQLKALHDQAKGLGQDPFFQGKQLKLDITGYTSQIAELGRRIEEFRKKQEEMAAHDIFGIGQMLGIQVAGQIKLNNLVHDQNTAENDLLHLKQELVRVQGLAVQQTQDGARNAKQEYELSKLSTGEAARQRILFDEQNQLVDARRNLQGAFLKQAEEGIRQEAQWRLMALGGNEVLKDRVKLLKDQAEQTQNTEDALLHSIDKGITGALGHLGQQFQGFTDMMLDVWQRRFIDPLLRSLTGIDLQLARMEQEFPGEGALRGGGITGGEAAGLGVGTLAFIVGSWVKQLQNQSALLKQISQDIRSLNLGLRDFHNRAYGIEDPYAGIADQANALRDQARKIRDEEYAAAKGTGAQESQLRKQADAEFRHTMDQILQDELAYIELIKKEQAAKAEEAAAEAAAQALDDLIAAREREVSAMQDALAMTTATVKALRDYSLQLRGGAGSPVQNLDFARMHFLDLAERARNGDQDAARELIGAGQSFLDQSRQYNASGAGYQSDLKVVMDIIDQLGDQYDVQRNLEQMQLDVLNQILFALRDRQQYPEGHPQPGNEYPPGETGGESYGGGFSAPSGAGAAVTVNQWGFRGVISRLDQLIATVHKTSADTQHALEGLQL